MKIMSDVISKLSRKERYKDSKIEINLPDRVENKQSNSNSDIPALKWDKVNKITSIINNPLKFHDELLALNELNYVKQYSCSMNRASPDFLAVSLIVAAAGIIGGSAIVIPKVNDQSWRIKITLWGMCIGNPSTLKTPLISAGLKPLRQAQTVVLDKYNERNIHKQTLNNELIEERIQALKDEAREAYKAGSEALGDKLVEEISTLNLSFDAEREVICNDLTPEALLKKLQRNPLGVLIVNDELSFLFSNMNKKGREHERSLLLEGFNASESKYIQERVGREKVIVPSVHISILGGIQPSMIATTLEERRTNSVNDGLMERFQLAVYPEPIEPEYVDEMVDENSVEIVYEIFKNLAQLGYQAPKEYRFSDGAQKQWNDWQSEFQAELKNYTAEEQAVRIKLPALAAKLACIFHLMDLAVGEEAFDRAFKTEISSPYLKRALLWIDYLWSHAQKIYGFNRIDPSVESLLNNLPKLSPSFTKHQLSQKCWKGLTASADRDKALKALEEHGYIQLVTKPKKHYVIHPDYRKKS